MSGRGRDDRAGSRGSDGGAGDLRPSPGLEERVDRVIEELRRQAEPEEAEELGYVRSRLVLLCRAGLWVLELTALGAGVVPYAALRVVCWLCGMKERSLRRCGR